jgi:hypothetical protein
MAGLFPAIHEPQVQTVPDAVDARHEASTRPGMTLTGPNYPNESEH